MVLYKALTTDYRLQASGDIIESELLKHAQEQAEELRKV
jgi:hypothetical protein